MANDVYTKSIKLLEEIDTHEMYFINNNDECINLFERLKAYNPSHANDINKLINYVKNAKARHTNIQRIMQILKNNYL